MQEERSKKNSKDSVVPLLVCDFAPRVSQRGLDLPRAASSSLEALSSFARHEEEARRRKKMLNVSEEEGRESCRFLLLRSSCVFPRALASPLR